LAWWWPQFRVKLFAKLINTLYKWVGCDCEYLQILCLLFQQEAFHIKFVIISTCICSLSFSLYHVHFIAHKSLRLFVLCWAICILIIEPKTTPYGNSVYFILSTLVYSLKHLCHCRKILRLCLWATLMRCCRLHSLVAWQQLSVHKTWAQSWANFKFDCGHFMRFCDTAWSTTKGLCVQLVHVFWTAHFLTAFFSLNQEMGNLVRV